MEIVCIWILFALSVKHSVSHNQLLTMVWQKRKMGCMKKKSILKLLQGSPRKMYLLKSEIA